VRFNSAELDTKEMTIPKFALNVALTFVCAFPLHSSGASVRMSSQSSDSSGQFNVAPVLSDSVNEVSQVLGMWRVGKWKLDDQYDVVANYFCFSDGFVAQIRIGTN